MIKLIPVSYFVKFVPPCKAVSTVHLAIAIRMQLIYNFYKLKSGVFTFIVPQMIGLLA